MLIRHYFNLRNQGRSVIALPVAAGVIGIVLAVILVPRIDSPAGALAAENETTFEDVHRIIQLRCVVCHSVTATHPTAPAAAAVKLDTTREIQTWAPRIFERVVVTRTMPLANLTEMTLEEREVIQRWYAGGAAVD